MATFKDSIGHLDSIYRTIVTRASWNDYINHADDERDKLRVRVNLLAVGLAHVEEKVKKCNGS